ncbi:MAG: VOC family protein [Pseudomonadota bacterium]|nr:VOC family protein [Pseudomonadota bacterium]
MSRALDHLVIACRDLDAAAARYRQLGFQVGPRNRHPWGTENHIVQFDGAFLELVGLGEGFIKPAPDDPVFPFAGFVAEFLARREGLAMVALRSDDAEADRRDFAAKGLGAFPRFDFARVGVRQGREVEVAFSLGFAECAGMPEAGFFVCQQKFPQNFWDAAAQAHPNGATGVAELAFVHPAPDAVAPFLSGFLDAEPAPAPGGDQFMLEGTRVTCMRANDPASSGLSAMRIATRGGASFWVD